MKSSSRSLLLCGFALLVALAFAACSPASRGGAESGSAGITITGAGSSFVYPLLSRWVAAFRQTHPNVQINYQPIGSGGGILQVKNNTVQFGASDMPLSDAQLATMPPVVQLPESGGPVCITYNLPQLKAPLRLSGDALAGIYLGQIKSWRDPAIVRANPHVALPNRPILVVHRSDGSGTTNIFTTYLTAVSHAWAQHVGAGLSVAWPVGLGGKGSAGVTGLVRQTDGAIGYVELTYAQANQLPVASVQNPRGEWVAPSQASSTAAIAAGSAALARDVRAPIVNEPAAGAYPITGLTFLILPRDGPDRAQRQALKEFIVWILGPGQSLAGDLNYAPLPPDLASRGQALLAQLRAGGQALP